MDTRSLPGFRKISKGSVICPHPRNEVCHVTRREVSAKSEGTSDSIVEDGSGQQL